MSRTLLCTAVDASGARPDQVIALHVAPPSADQLSRGLQAARAIEHTAGLVRKARSHAGTRAPRKLAWSHGRARRQLKKLRRTLEGVQRNVLAQGASEARFAALSSLLATLDAHLELLLETTVRKETLREMRRIAKRARRHLHQA